MTLVEDLQEATEGVSRETSAAVMAIYARWKAGDVSLDDAVALIAAVLNRASASAATVAEVYLVAQIEELAEVSVLSTGTLPEDHSEALGKAVRTVLTEPPKKKLKQAEVRALIRSADLDPAMWNVPVITTRVNESIREMLPDPDEPDHVPDNFQYQFEDFIETVNENPKSLSERGLFPPPPPHTPEYEQWKVDSVVPELDSDDYTDMPPVWEAEPDNAEMRLERLAKAVPFEAAQVAVTVSIRRQPLVGGWIRQMDSDPCQLCRWWYRDGKVWPKDHPFQSHNSCNCQLKIVLAEVNPTIERIAS